MEVKEVALTRDKDGKLRPIDSNSELIEQSAMNTILSIMSSSAKPDIRLDAARAALDMIGKRIPAETQAKQVSSQPVVQFNFGSHVVEALAGMEKMKELSQAESQKTVFIRNPNTEASDGK